MTWDLDKAFVQGKVMPDGVLPTLLVVAVVREVLQKETFEEVMSTCIASTLQPLSGALKYGCLSFMYNKQNET